VSSFEIPWGAWFGDRRRTLALPDGYRTRVHRIAGGERVSSDDVARLLAHPVESAPLAELARGRTNAVIAVEDMSRPSRLDRILPAVLEQIHAAGISRERVWILVGSGAHGPLDRQSLVKKLGRAVVDGYDVVNHHPYENLVDLGRSERGIPILINKDFAESDLKIAVGSVVPHPYAGFGGGAKIVLPGVSGIETLYANHRPAITGLQGGFGDVENNSARREMEEIAMRVGLEFIVNIVSDERRDAVGVFAGHPVHAHRAAVRRAREVYRTKAPETPADVIVLNAFPKDTELLQVGNAFNVLRGSSASPVRPGGTVVVTAACSLGRGVHSLHGPRMRLYRAPVERAHLEGRPVIFYSPNLSEHDARASFWTGYAFERTWGGVVRRLVRTVGAEAAVSVFPCAPLQLLED